MAVDILRPNAAGASTAIHHQNPSSGAHWDKNDEVTVDFNTTSVYTKFIGSTPPRPNDPGP